MESEQLIADLREGKNKEAIAYLFEYLPTVKAFILKYGGSESDAEDIFQEALIVFYTKTLNTDFNLEVKAHTYLFSICKYKWKDELKKKNRNITFSEEFDIPVHTEFEEEEEEVSISKLNEIIGSLGDICKNILSDYYYSKLSMAEIAQKMGYKNENTAKTQKYKCLERARKMALETLTK